MVEKSNRSISGITVKHHYAASLETRITLANSQRSVKSNERGEKIEIEREREDAVFSPYLAI